MHFPNSSPMQLAYGPLVRAQGLDVDPGGPDALKTVLAFEFCRCWYYLRTSKGEEGKINSDLCKGGPGAGILRRSFPSGEAVTSATWPLAAQSRWRKYTSHLSVSLLHVLLGLHGKPGSRELQECYGRGQPHRGSGHTRGGAAGGMIIMENKQRNLDPWSLTKSGSLGPGKSFLKDCPPSWY